MQLALLLRDNCFCALVADVLELPREESPAKLASSERSSEGGEDTGCSVEAGDIDEVRFCRQLGFGGNCCCPSINMYGYTPCMSCSCVCVWGGGGGGGGGGRGCVCAILLSSSCGTRCVLHVMNLSNSFGRRKKHHGTSGMH